MNLNEARRVIVQTHLASLKANHRSNAIELISGPGIGKSETVVQSCKELARAAGEPVGMVTFMLATVSSVDIRGFMLPTKGTGPVPDTVFSVPPWFPTRANMRVFMPDGTTVGRGAWEGPLPRVGAVFLDEFGQAEDDVRKAAAELLLHGEVGDTVLPQGWRVVAASNRMTDRSGVVRPLMFLVNRRMEIRVEASLPAWLEWANSQPAETRCHYLTLSFAQKNPDLVFRDAVPAGADPFCTPRTLCLMNRDLTSLRTDEDITRDKLPITPVAREVAAGWIGQGEAAQFFTHLRFADELPDIEDIERDPRTAKLPPNRDAQMVAGYMLAHNIAERNVKPLMGYISRLHIEMQVLTMRAILGQADRARPVIETKECAAWLTKNIELLKASRA